MGKRKGARLLRSATLARDFVMAWSWPRINTKIKQQRLQIFYRNNLFADQTKRAVKFERGVSRFLPNASMMHIRAYFLSAAS